MAIDFEPYESLYDYLLGRNKQYVALLRQGISHQQMIEEGSLGDSVSVEELRDAEKTHASAMNTLASTGLYCQVCEGKPCNIQEIAEELIARIRFIKSDDNEPSTYDTITTAGYLQQRASNRHSLSNYDEIISELPQCCLFTDQGNCGDHLFAYHSIKQAATF